MPESEEPKEPIYVTWNQFTWILGALTVAVLGIIGWMISVDNDTRSKVEAMNPQFVQVQTQLSQIQTDINWIKLTLSSK